MVAMSVVYVSRLKWLARVASKLELFELVCADHLPLKFMLSCRPGYRSNFGRRDGPPSVVSSRYRRSPPPRGGRRRSR